MPEIKNLKKAAKRILEAVKNKERIILYGDSDMDGVSAVIIAKEAVSNLGGEVTRVYFPEREEEGYGLNEKALSKLKKEAPALLITFDCGISNFKEAQKAKKLGFELIIIDHHQILDKLPQAEIIVDPKQKGDRYPFKDFCGAGLSYKLAQTLLPAKFSGALRKDLSELAALATIADMMSETDDNKTIIEEGLSSLEQSFRPGIQALLKVVQLNVENFNLRQKASKIIGLLNVRDVEEGLPASFRILTMSSAVEAEELARSLWEKNLVKMARVKEITAQVLQRAESQKDLPLIFEGSSEWDLPLLGQAASKVVKQFEKPAFLFKKLPEESFGSVRAPSNLDSVALMKKCGQHLVAFGGHAPASGFRIKNKNLEKFKECLIKNFPKR